VRATGAVEVKGGGDGSLAASAMLLSGGSGIVLVGQDCRIDSRDIMERPDWPGVHGRFDEFDPGTARARTMASE
jgi:hypothetical protein